MYIWKLTRAASGYDEPNTIVLSAETELEARLFAVQSLAQASSSVAAEFALDSTNVEQIGTAMDGELLATLHAIESTDFIGK